MEFGKISTTNMTNNKKSESSEKIELRSEDDSKLLEEKYSSVIGWGTAAIVTISLILLLVVCFIPYPNSNGESIIQHIIFDN